MTETDTQSRLIAILRSSQEIPEDDPYFGPEVDLFDYGYLDSFGIVMFIGEIKDAYGVDLAGVDFYSPGFRTVADLSRYIDRQRAA